MAYQFCRGPSRTAGCLSPLSDIDQDDSLRRGMTLGPSFNSLQYPHQHDGSLSKFHSQLGDLRDGGEVSTLSTSQQGPQDVIGPASPWRLHSPGSSTYASGNPLNWERLVRGPLSTHERISLITTILSNRDEVGIVRCLREGDAQAFVDVVFEACSCVLSSK